MNKAERNILKNCYEHYQEYPEATEHDITRYCDHTMGNDYSGDGEVSNPYKTPIRAMQDVAHVIAHKVTIALNGPASYPAASFPRKIDNVIEGDGSLTFYGVGAPTVKAAHGGPHAVTAIANQGDAEQLITIGAAAGWVADEFVGYWVRVVTGGHVGRTFAIYGNTTTTISIGQQTDEVHNGDTIEIIAPTIHVTIDTELDVFYDSHSGATDPAYGFSRLTFANLWFDAAASTSYYSLRVHGTDGTSEGPNFDFVRFDAPDLGISVSDTIINVDAPVETGYVVACGASIANMGTGVIGAGLSMTSVGSRAVVLVNLYGNVSVMNAAISGRVQHRYGGFVCFSGGCAAFQAWKTTCGDLLIWCAGVSAAVNAVDLSGGAWCVNLVVPGPCKYAINTDYNTNLRIHAQCVCSATLCDLSAIRVGPMCKIAYDTSLAVFLGKTAGQGAYIFYMDAAVKAATWPVAGTFVTDAKGGELLRVA